MMSRLAITAAVFLFTAGVALSQPCPGVDWCENPATGHWYSRTTSTGNWSQAESQAVAAGGHLVTINDVAENDWLRTFFPNPTTFWIGLMQLPGSQEPLGGWVWVDGDPSAYRNWGHAEPNDFQGEDCGNFFPSSGNWNDNACFKTYRGIIERETSPFVPTVSEWGLAVMVMMLLIGGTTIFARRRVATA
jgi:Lectin C-type domain/IPTL-CTERM motif